MAAATAKSAFWREVDRVEKRLVSEIKSGLHPAQPKLSQVFNPESEQMEERPESLWITSEYNRALNLTAGSICAIGFRTGCQRIAEGGFRLSTVEEVESYREAGRRRKVEYDAEDQRLRKARFEIALPGASKTEGSN